MSEQNAGAVVLFDIDGTIVTTGGAGSRAMGRAFGDVLGNGSPLVGVSIAGMTDQGIFRLACETLNVPYTEPLGEEIMRSYLRFLPDEVAASAGYTVHPNIEAAIDACESLPHVATGLGTGNFEIGARIKLGRAGLSARFAFGGFGDDAEPREELIAAGVKRGVAVLESKGLTCDTVVIIGDTPHDITAAHKIGATCVTVATGSFSRDTLTEAGADVSLQDFSKVGAIDTLMALLPN